MVKYKNKTRENKNRLFHSLLLCCFSSGYSPPFRLGHDCRLRPVREHGGLRRDGQHAHSLRREQQGRQRGRQNIARVSRIRRLLVIGQISG